MPTSLATNRAARDAVLARVRQALGKESRAAARTDAEAYIATHGHGPRPALPADLVARFLQRATDMQSTVERLADRRDIPAAVVRYVDALDLPPALAAQKSHAGVCWPEFADLDWAAAELAIEARRRRATIASASPARSAPSPRPARWSCWQGPTRRRRPRCCRTRTSPSFARIGSCRGWRRRSR